MLTTTTVRCTIHYPDGSAAAGVGVRAHLTHDEVDGGVVVPRLVEGTTDEDGIVDLDLWPNTRGVNGSQYSVVAVAAAGWSTLFQGLATVPESGSVVNLHSILTDPPPTVDAAQQAVEDAQAARDLAQTYAAASAAAAGLVGVTDVAGTSHTTTFDQVNHLFRFTGSDSATLTIAPQADVAWPEAAQIHVLQSGTGNVTIAGGAGVTLLIEDGLSAQVAAQYSVVSAIRVAEDTWLLVGRLLESI